MRRVCVTGGGATGLAAAKWAACEGARITLAEKGAELKGERWDWVALV